MTRIAFVTWMTELAAEFPTAAEIFEGFVGAAFDLPFPSTACFSPYNRLALVGRVAEIGLAYPKLQMVAENVVRLLFMPAGGAEVTSAEREITLNEGKIAGIKAYRQRTGLGLKASKDAIEAACPHARLSY